MFENFTAAYKNLAFFKVRTVNPCGVVGPWSTTPVVYQKVRFGEGYVWKNVSSAKSAIEAGKC